MTTSIKSQTDSDSKPTTTTDIAIALVRLIQRQRFDLSTEKNMQYQMTQVLVANNIEFEREKSLSKRDIPDFLVAGGIVIECKLRGARRMDVYKQLCRYAEHEQVSVLILASNLTMGIQPELNNKPVFFASCSRGYL